MSSGLPVPPPLILWNVLIMPLIVAKRPQRGPVHRRTPTTQGFLLRQAGAHALATGLADAAVRSALALAAASATTCSKAAR